MASNSTHFSMIHYDPLAIKNDTIQNSSKHAIGVDFLENDNRNDEKNHTNTTHKRKKSSGSGGFDVFQLCPPLKKALHKLGYQQPTPIQRRAIPPIVRGGDVVAMARTGSGKTAAFLVPCIERLVNHAYQQITMTTNTAASVRAIILSPTRDLAIQTMKVAKLLAKFTNLRIALLVGGEALSAQFEALEQHPDIIIATPGRLVHHLLEVKFQLTAVQMVIFDEADRLFEMGFAVQLHEILKKMPESRQTLLFSATLPSQVVEFSRAGLRDPMLIRLDTDMKVSPLLKVAFYTLRKEQKNAALLWLLQTKIPTGQQTLVFTATKHHVEFLTQLLNAAGINCCGVYGSLDSTARKLNISKFRSRKVDVLIVTDVAARGLDIPLLDNVVNYDFSPKPKLFVHRVGRVARAGRSGAAYNLVANDEMPYMVDLHLFLGRRLKNQLDDHNLNVDENEFYFGRLPSQILETFSETVKSLVSAHQLEAIEATAQRSYGLYYKSRPSASNASVYRVKEMGSLTDFALHPEFRHSNSEDITVDDYLKHIHNFRASSTIFEVENHVNSVMKIKRKVHGHLMSNVSKSSSDHSAIPDVAATIANDITTVKEDSNDCAGSGELSDKTAHSETRQSAGMLTTETVDEGFSEDNHEQASLSAIDLLLKQQRQASLKPTPSLARANFRKRRRDQTNQNASVVEGTSRYRDPKFFISIDMPSLNTAEERGYSLDDRTTKDAVLDFAGDDADSLLKAQHIRRWDKRKKNYVIETKGGDPFKNLRDDNGRKVTDGPKGLYAKWKKKHKRSTEDETTLVEDGDEGIGNGEASVRGPQSFVGRADRRGNARSLPSAKRAAMSSSKQSKRPKSELRSEAEVRSLRLQKAKNMIKNRKGGFKAHSARKKRF